MPKSITKKINLNKYGLKKIKGLANRQEAVQEVAEYLEDTVLDYVSKGLSPVSGSAFRPLSKGYKKIKGKISGSATPNMELYGDMLDEFDVRTTGGEVSIGFHSDTSELTRNKADNHNKWTAKSKKTKVPKRQFIPKDEQNFDKEIMDDIREIIREKINASKNKETP